MDEKENIGIENSGYKNTGDYNSGNYNSGYRNSGYFNKGQFNSGNRNSGDYNSGDGNSGSYNNGSFNSGNNNSGDFNSGNFNSGYYNSGEHNDGYYNSGKFNNGWFNRGEPKMKMFDKECDYTYTEFRNTFGYSGVLLPLNTWVNERDMTEEEKATVDGWAETGGYLKTLTYKEAWAQAWSGATQEQKDWYQKLPNFDAAIFEEITGIKV